MNHTELTAWRCDHGYTQAQLGERLDVSPNTLARYERGDLAVPRWMPLALKGLLFSHGARCTCTQCRRRYHNTAEAATRAPRPLRLKTRENILVGNKNQEAS